MFKALRKRWYLIVIILAIIGFLLYRQNATKVKATKQTTHKVTKKTIKDTLSLSGKIEATEKVALRFQSSGKLTWVGVKEGDYVKKYQTLATLDQRDIQKRLQKYLNTYSQQRLTFDQTKDDDREVIIGLLTPDQRQRTMRAYEKSQFDLNNSVLDVELQSIAAESANLISPIDGVVTHADTLQAGVNITPATAEFDIVNPDTLYFSALADQTEVVKLSEGMLGSIIFDAFDDAEPVSTEIRSISFVPKDGETGTVYELKLPVTLDNKGYRLGMTGDVDFVLTEHPNVLAVPVKYISNEGDKQFVYKLVNGTAEKTYIETGLSDDTYTEVTSGLKEGDTVYDKTP